MSNHKRKPKVDSAAKGGKELEVPVSSTAIKILTKARGEIEKIEDGAQSSLRTQLADVYKAALMLKADSAQREQFFNDAYFKRQFKRQPKDKHLLRMTFCFTLNAKMKSPRYHRACAYARSLSASFEEGVSSQDVRRELKKRGIDWLFNSSKEPHRTRKMKPLAQDDDSACSDAPLEKSSAKRRDDGERISEEASGAAGNGSGNPSTAKTPNTDEPPRARPRAVKSAEHPNSLVVGMSGAMFCSVMRLKVNGTATLTIRRLPNDANDYKLIVADALGR